MANSRICSIPECSKRHDARGLCSTHYRRLQRTGRALGSRRISDRASRAERRAFLKTAIEYRGSDCLLWPFKMTAGSYPLIKIDGVQHLVHRLVCEARFGPAPFENAEVAHSCGNSACLGHLRWATRSDNLSDRWFHGTMYMGSKQWASKLTEADVRIIRELHACGKAGRKALCKRFGISLSAMSAVISRRTWAWVD